MELDDLKRLWQETDRRLATLEPALRLDASLARAGALDRIQARVRLVRAVLWYEIGFGVLAVLLLGSYLFDHLGTARFALPAAALHLTAIALLGLAVWQLLALARADFAGPVVELHRRLAELRVARARVNRWLLLASPLLWALLVVVVPHALVGFDVTRAFGTAWVGANLLFGVAVLAIGLWAARRLPAGSRSSTCLQRLGDDLAGRRLAAAAGLLEEIASFEREESLRS